MKIFNWVHRRCIPKDGLGQNHVKKDEEILGNNDHADTAALLESVVPAEMLQLHGWGAGAGILSIGTFGLKDTFGINHEHNYKEYFGLMGKADQDPESDDDQCSDESDHDVDYDESEDDNSSYGEEDYEEEEWNPLVYDKSGAPRPTSAIIIGNNIDAKLLRPSHLLAYPEHDNNYYKIINKEKKERITLADLFSADSDDGIGNAKKPNNYRKTRPQSECIKINKTTPQTPDHRAAKNGTLLLFPKKLIPRVKEDSRPIQKLHGLMKRMLKRKIHPDVVEGKVRPCAAGNGILPCANGFGINETVSLLQSQDATSEL